MTDEKLASALKTLIIRNLELQLHMLALERALTESGAVDPEKLRLIREQVRREGKAHLDSLAAATPEKLLAMLQGPGGPVQ